MDPSDKCIEWEGPTNGAGYGQVDRRTSAHRHAYEQDHGAIPPGLDVHHTCENKLCINTNHMMLLTRKEHKVLHASTRTHCPHGHPFDENNTYYEKNGRGRRCRECSRMNARKYYERKKCDHTQHA